MQQNSDLIHYSRAGDIFHYRWAVKRCLRLLDFNTNLIRVTIEGSSESSLAGECVVDLTEYRLAKDGKEHAEYFQLKHSTVQENKPFTLSLLKDTVEGFAKRFSELIDAGYCVERMKFTIITNRLISSDFKVNIDKLAKEAEAPAAFTNTVKKYTKLKGKALSQFCQCLTLCDSEGNYDEQKYDIHKELAKISNSVGAQNRETLLVAKIWEKIEPGKSNVITQEHILAAFDAISLDDFFPAAPLFESISNYIPRDEQTSIVTSIKLASTHTIIIANGGVGKSILSSNLHQEFNEPSIVVAYDCFGNGSYRRTSAKRHEVKHACTQVINTLAIKGLCDQIIPERSEPDEYWIKAFLNRIKDVCDTLVKQDSNALLVIIFDAADNAEMAAEEQGTKCFANQLLKEVVPNNCRLIFTCRPERLKLLAPPSTIKPLYLSPFSIEETLENLQAKYSPVTKEQATEFCRLTGGNPRVQFNALSLKMSSLDKLLFSFGNKVTTVEDLIERQLNESVARIKDEFPKNYQSSIDNICTGLAVLPPFVPIEVLAKAASVDADLVRSFIADLGHPLWQIDDTVQFRDEPTEKWFQDNYSATPEKIYSFVKAIKLLATELSYVSESLPLLLLKAEQLDELVALALSNDYLPSISSYDDNQVKVQRLQYAFKAALKANRTYEAVKLALLAGEEIAGNDRQISILMNNLDLVSLFLSSNRIQELAHRKELQGHWDGSGTVYSASLLSSIPSLKGEALSYLRSANYWLNRYFQKRDEAKDEEESFNDKLEDIEILELAFTQYKVNGWQKCVDFLLSWTPPSFIFKITSSFMERLVDSEKFDQIELMVNYGKHNPSFIIGMTSALIGVGRVPPIGSLVECLNQIIKSESRLERPADDFHDKGFSNEAYLSFFEACLIHNLPTADITEALNYYYNPPSLYRVADNHQYENSRGDFLRYLSIKSALKGNYSLKFDDYIPESWKRKSDGYENNSKLKKAKEATERLLPFYMVRAKLLSGIKLNLIQEHKLASNSSSRAGFNSYHEYDPVPFEITRAKFQNILLCSSNFEEELALFATNYNDNKLKVSFQDDFYFLRVSCRSEKFIELSETIENSCYSRLKQYDYDDDPETRSGYFIQLSRAVLAVSKQDATSYFDEALKRASDFGQEGVVRWEALTSIAKRSAIKTKGDPELAHRYMRCAEMIGDSVAREKYWDRDDAVSTCFQLSPESAFPILNKWKDRNIGWHSTQIIPLVNSAIESNLISPAALWSLSTFSWEYGRNEFLQKCLEREPSKSNQQLMLNDYVRYVRVKGGSGKKWIKLNKLAVMNGLEFIPINELQQLVKSSQHENKKTQSLSDKPKELVDENNQWNMLYSHFDLCTDTGFTEAFQLFERQGYPREVEKFWQGCINKVTSRNLGLFLNIITYSEQLDFLDLRSGFGCIPNEWKSKLSVQKFWNTTIKYVASRFPNRFTEIYERSYMLRGFLLNEETHRAIEEGIIIGLSNSIGIESPRTLFSFAHYSANILTTEQAKELIDFGLSRLEHYLEEDYADGVWNAHNQLPNNPSHAVTCYIYANLGSPHAEERWRAVHAVFRLCNLNCQSEISLLLECYNSGLPTAYIPKKYKFYELHAKLYLLVALTRCAHSCPKLLLSSKDIIASIALNKEQGILFQYYAKQICLTLQCDKKDCFDVSTYQNIQQACMSQHSTLDESKYNYSTDSPWHTKKILGALPEVIFAYDFDSHWFQPLGDVFGIPSSQVEDIAKYILINQWGVSFKSSHIPDAREALWKRQRAGSSYPNIDDYAFYISYHLVLEVASKLLEAMPSTKSEWGNSNSNSWDNWLNGQLLLNRDNVLLSELRDPIPLLRPDWMNDNYDEDWPWQILENHFIDHLVIKDEQDLWLNVEGGWNDYKDGRNERVFFSSVLVPKALSPSFLYATLNTDNRYECYLNRFCDSEYGKSLDGEFYCKEWLMREEGWEDNDIESKDPHAGIIKTNPFKLSDEITSLFNITYAEHDKNGLLPSDNQICLQNKYWSDDKPSTSDSYASSGSSARVSLEFLIDICNRMDMDIAIQVNIKRSFTSYYSQNRRKNDKLGYIPKYSKTFILSGDGKLRDTRKSYQLR